MIADVIVSCHMDFFSEGGSSEEVFWECGAGRVEAFSFEGGGCGGWGDWLGRSAWVALTIRKSVRVPVAWAYRLGRRVGGREQGKFVVCATFDEEEVPRRDRVLDAASESSTKAEAAGGAASVRSMAFLGGSGFRC